MDLPLKTHRHSENTDCAGRGEKGPKIQPDECIRSGTIQRSAAQNIGSLYVIPA